jgi:cytidine deaminase
MNYSPESSPPPIPPHREALLAQARAAAEHAYAPYSRFRVGAVVMAGDGRCFTGCNVENASYGLSLCAERSALASAIAAGVRRLVAVAVACPDAAPELGLAGRMPCGACRQWMLELAPDATLHIDGVDRWFSCRELLPEGFRL